MSDDKIEPTIPDVEEKKKVKTARNLSRAASWLEAAASTIPPYRSDSDNEPSIVYAYDGDYGRSRRSEMSEMRALVSAMHKKPAKYESPHEKATRERRELDAQRKKLANKNKQKPAKRKKKLNWSTLTGKPHGVGGKLAKKLSKGKRLW